MEPLNIKHISLNHIDKDLEKVTSRIVNIDDAKEYISDLVTKMLENTLVREFQTKDGTNSVISEIINIINTYRTTSQDTEIAATSLYSHDEMISLKLLDAQITAQERYKQLTKIKKGSLIQSLIENDNEYIYILALVDHSFFLDESDLAKKMGLPDSKKAALKSARIHLNTNLSINKIYLSDSQTRISEYWYDGFLDLKESKSDILNTKKAYNCIKGLLSENLSANHKPDLLEYNNALNVYFSTKDSFSIDDCLDFVFSIEPIDDTINKEDLKTKIKERNIAANLFDNTFTVDNTDIKRHLRNIKYTLNTNVELKVKSTDARIKESIYTHKLDNGDLILAIKNVDIKELNRFNFYNINLKNQ